jgi:hypothetical protein
VATNGRGAQTRATERETTQRFFLRDLEGKGVSFCPLSAEEMIHEGLAVVARSSQSLTAPHNLARASLAPRSSPKAQR